MKYLKLSLILFLTLILIPYFTFAGGSKGAGKKEEKKAPAPAEKKAPKRVTLKIIWEDWGADLNKYMTDDWTKKFEKDNPNIKLQWLIPPNWKDKEIATLAGGEKNFDIFFMRPSFLPSIVQRGGLIPLDDFFAKSGIKKEDFVTAAMDTCIYNGKIYAIPGGTDFIAWYYNKDILKDAGYDPENPKILTKDDVEQADKRITKRDANGKLIRIGYMPIDIYQLIDWGYMFGGEWYNPKTHKVTGNDPHIVAALTWLVKLVDFYGYNDLLELRGTYSEWSGSSPDHPFNRGIAAFMPNGWWNYEILEQYAPNLKWGIINFPTLTGDPKERSRWVVMGWSVSIPKGCPHIKEAWQFLKYCFYDQAAAFGAISINSPSVKKAFPEFERLIREKYGKDSPVAKYMPKFDDIGRYATKHFPVTPAGDFFDKELERDMGLAMAHKLTPKQALDQFTERVQKQIDRALGK